MEYTTVFKNELQRAQYFEKKTAELYKQLGYEVEFMDGNSKKRKFWDLKVTKNGISKLIEVKLDMRCSLGRNNSKPTGNIYLEIESRGEPSGLKTTKADYLIYWLSEKYYIIFTDIKRLRTEIRSFPIIYGGDNNSSKGNLIKLRTLKELLGEREDESKAYSLKVF